MLSINIDIYKLIKKKYKFPAKINYEKLLKIKLYA